MSGDVEALAKALLYAIDRVDDGFGYHDVESRRDREKGCRDLAAALLASDWMKRHDAEVRAGALREAADELDGPDFKDGTGDWLDGACDAIEALRRRADREQP